MTGPAIDFLRLDDRSLRVGAIADIAVLDGDRIHDRATCERPRPPSEGTVDGRLAVQDGDATGAPAGRSIRRPQHTVRRGPVPAGRLPALCAALVMRVAEWLYRA